MKKSYFFYSFMIPTFIILLFLAFYPLANAIFFSLHDWDLRATKPMNFVGLRNYVDIFTDNRFINSLKVSGLWLLLTFGGSVFVGTFLAPIINERTSGAARSLCLFAFILPAVLPRIGAAYMWRLMYSPSIGVINYMLSLFWVSPVGFLQNPSIALFSIVIIDVWQWGFLITALLLILLQDVPKEVIEAANLDGANKLILYTRIIFPIILPVSLPILFIKMMESLRSFDFIFVLTAGGPGISTETLDMYAYWQGIGSAGRISLASAMSVMMVVFSIVLITSLWRAVEKWHT